MALLLLHASTGLVVHSGGPSRTLATPRHAAAQCGLFDMFKESDASKAAKDEAWKTQQEMLARRRDPKKMKEYEDDVLERRRANMKEGAELKALQANTAGADTLEAWQQLKAEGKVLASDDMERDADSSRLGSAGLIDARIDTNLPFIDQADCIIACTFAARTDRQPAQPGVHVHCMCIACALHAQYVFIACS